MEDDELTPAPDLSAPKPAAQTDQFLPRLRLSDIIKVIAVLIVLDIITFFIFASIVYAVNHGEVEQLRTKLDNTPQDIYLLCCDIDSQEYLVLSKFDPYQDAYIPTTLPGNCDILEAAFLLCHTTLQNCYSYSQSKTVPKLKGYEYVPDPLDDGQRISFYIDKNGIYLTLSYRKIAN